MKSYKSHFCHTAVAVCISGFKYRTSVASRIATKVTQTVHEIAQFFSQLWKLQDTFPTSFVSHVSPSSCHIQSPHKTTWALSCSLRCTPRFSWQGVTWSCCGALPQHSVRSATGRPGSVPHQRQQNCLKLNRCTQLGLQSWNEILIILSVFRNWRRIKMWFLSCLFGDFFTRCSVDVFGWRQALPALSHIWAQRSNL